MSEKKSDFLPASIGFFGGAIILALILFGISMATTSKYKAKEAATAEHKTP